MSQSRSLVFWKSWERSGLDGRQNIDSDMGLALQAQHLVYPGIFYRLVSIMESVDFTGLTRMALDSSIVK